MEGWSTITPAQMISAIKKRFPSVLVTTLVVAAMVVGILLVWPNQYSSDGLFYARLGRGAVAIDPTTDSKRAVSLQDSRSSEVASISELLNSREIADRVVKTVGADEINRPRNWIEQAMKKLSTLSPAGSDEPEFKAQIEHEEAVKTVRSAIAVDVPKNSYTISVLAKASDPQLAQAMVQAIMEEYGAVHVEAHQSTGSLDFFVKQAEESEKTAKESRQALHQALNENGGMSAVEAEKSLRERIVNLELSLDTAQSSLADATSQATSLKQRLESVEQWIPMEMTTVADAASDGMKTQLYEFQLKDGEKLSKVTANHPRYRVLKDKIDQGKEIVESNQDEREQTREAYNPIYLQLEGDYQAAETRAAGFASRRDSLEASLQQVRTALKRLNESAPKLAQLGWAASIAEKNYLSHAQSLEASRLVHELDKQQMTDVSVIQNASLNLKKVGPPRAALACIGAFLGLCLGMIQALLRVPVTAAQESVASSEAKEREQDYLSLKHELGSLKEQLKNKGMATLPR